MYSWEFWFATEVTGSGDVASGVSVAGQASETFAAAGAVATPSIAISGTGAETFAGAGSVAVGIAISGSATVEGAPVVVALPIPDGIGIAGPPRPPLAEMMAAQTATLARQDAERDAAIAAIRSSMAPYRDDPEELWLLGLITDQEWIAA